MNNQKPQTKPETVEPPSDRRSGSILCSLPPPFYADDRCTIYHGDCKELIGRVEDDAFELVLTDPPWKASDQKIVRVQGGVAPSHSPSLAYGELGFFDAEVLEQCKRVCANDVMVICGYKELKDVLTVLDPCRGIFVWHKPNGGRAKFYPAALDTAYIAWWAKTSKLYGFQHWESSVFSVPVPSAGCVTNGERVLTPDKKAAHPAQGPLRLYKELLKATDGVVLDPYLGSGTTLVAAKLNGRRAVGFEKEERFCEMAANRCRQGVLF